MATAHMKVYEKNIEKLVKALPMHDVKFTTQLRSNKILPDSVDEHIKSLPTKSVKADYYLKNVIKSSLDIDEKTEFEKLLTVMEKCEYPHIERLASKMKSDLDKEVKAKASKSKETKGKKSDDAKPPSKAGVKRAASITAKASESKEAKGKKSDDAKLSSKAGVKRAASISAKSSESPGTKKLKPSDKCSKAMENIKTNYTKLTSGFPIDGLLTNLYSENVIDDVQKETIHKEKLKNKKVSFLFDEVIIPELKIGISTPKYDNLIKVMEASDDTTANHLADVLKGTKS